MFYFCGIKFTWKSLPSVYCSPSFRFRLFSSSIRLILLLLPRLFPSFRSGLLSCQWCQICCLQYLWKIKRNEITNAAVWRVAKRREKRWNKTRMDRTVKVLSLASSPMFLEKPICIIFPFDWRRTWALEVHKKSTTRRESLELLGVLLLEVRSSSKSSLRRSWSFSRLRWCIIVCFVCFRVVSLTSLCLIVLCSILNCLSWTETQHRLRGLLATRAIPLLIILWTFKSFFLLQRIWILW